MVCTGASDALTLADLSGKGTQRYAVIAGSDTEEGKKAIKAAHRVTNGGVFVHESSANMDELMGIFFKGHAPGAAGKCLANKLR